ncbi:Acg family FMN-binding oxidoreductase [Leminorella grimontii]|uniref:Acg family FMN-binding oxidoreductase n=1 Tax=Leminorella grimontii TaxID=82981 RepID=UPI00207EDAAC|nr:hypothetical protein [Leminorella grimontii]GKX59698.1 hypothetical protein SOASR031_20130 [Leminorella grimontii]
MHSLENATAPVSRRACIRLLSGGLLLIGGLTSLGCTRRVSSETGASNAAALQHADPRYRWLIDASRAPSPHNMQPWLVDLNEAPDVITLYADRQRFLPVVDPKARQSMIGLGAFLELLCLSAQADSYRCEVSLFPQGEILERPVARINVIPHSQNVFSDDLYRYVHRRHSNRQVYDSTRLLAQSDLDALTRAATCHGVLTQGSLQPDTVARVSTRAAAAWVAELHDEALVMETLHVTRIGACEIESFRDGIAVQGFIPELMSSVGLFPRDRMPDKNSVIMQNMSAMGEAQANSAAAWVWVTTEGNDRSQQVEAGRAYVRLHLAAARLNVALHPMSQALEPYSPHYQGLYEDLAVLRESRTIQMIARLGYTAAETEPPSLRRSVDSFLTEST